MGPLASFSRSSVLRCAASNNSRETLGQDSASSMKSKHPSERPVGPSLPKLESDAEQESSSAQGVSLPKIVPFKTLAKCGDEVWIEHEGQLYRLRRTKQDKLILTK